MADELNRAYDALQKADQSGNVDDAKQIAQYIQTLQTKQSTEDSQVNTLYGAVAGFGAGQMAGPMLNAGAKEFQRAQIAKAQGVNPSEVVLQKAADGTDRWALSSGKALGDSPHIIDRVNAYKAAEDELNALKARQNAPVGGVAKHGTRAATLSAEELSRITQLEHDLGPGRLAALQKIAGGNMSAGEKLAETLGIPRMGQTAARALGAGVSRGVPAVIGRGIAGAGAGFQGTDAYNRFQQGDIAGGLIGGLGALGSAATLIPHPLARVGGTVVGLGAEALNMYLDSLKNKPAMASGGHVKPKSKAHAAAMHLMAHKTPHMAGGGTPEFNVSAQSMPSMSGLPGVGYMQTPQGAIMRAQFEQELADRARLRAGATGVGMAIPGQHGVKMMPGNIETGVNIPVGAGNIDISGRRSINPVNMPAQRGGHMYGANVQYTLPFKNGGDV